MKRKRRFVVGYCGDKQVVYGRDYSDGSSAWAIPVTLKEAKKRLAMLSTVGHPKAIYELVVKVRVR